MNGQDVRGLVDRELLPGIDQLLALFALVLVLSSQLVRLGEHVKSGFEVGLVVDVH
jgi:hypothetical protein